MANRHITTSVQTVLLAVLILVLGLPLAQAMADGDPASDVLLVQNVFFPYEPATSPRLMQELTGATAQAAKAGVPVKVALIASPFDLGVIPQLFGKPQIYADYLDEEISFNGPQPLLVVMADGYGMRALPAGAVARVVSMPLPAGKTSDALAAAALTAVERIAAAEGHPITSATLSPATATGSSGTGLMVGVMAAVAVAAAAAIAVITLRRRRAAV